jgi:hypothetical protein
MSSCNLNSNFGKADFPLDSSPKQGRSKSLIRIRTHLERAHHKFRFAILSSAFRQSKLLTLAHVWYRSCHDNIYDGSAGGLHGRNNGRIAMTLSITSSLKVKNEIHIFIPQHT